MAKHGLLLYGVKCSSSVAHWLYIYMSSVLFVLDDVNAKIVYGV